MNRYISYKHRSQFLFDRLMYLYYFEITHSEKRERARLARQYERFKHKRRVKGHKHRNP